MNILITGGSHGIGCAIAERLARNADALLVTGRDSRALASLSARIASSGTAQVHSVIQEFSEREAAENVAKWAREKVNSLDVLVLNAGYYQEGSLHNFSEFDMRRNLEVNFLINLFLVQKLLPLLKNGRRRRIVIIGSTAAYEPYPLVPSYGVTKWALRGLATNLRAELKDQDIGVSFVSPGPTWTQMWEGEELPRQRLLEADDIAIMVEASLSLSAQAVMDEIIVRPMLGDMHG